MTDNPEVPEAKFEKEKQIVNMIESIPSQDLSKFFKGKFN